MNPMDSPLVAIVDDDELFRRSVERVVGSADFGVETFGSTEDTLERGTWMAPRDGFDLQRRLISRPRPMPIVFVSVREDAVTRANALRAGAIAFLKKPFDNNTLTSGPNSVSAR